MKKIYHNPRCGKSRKALQKLEEKYTDITVVEYLKDAPTYDEIKKLANLLHLSPYQMIRTGEEIFKTHFADKDIKSTDWAKALVEYPILLQRPIVVDGTKAMIVRDEDSLAAL
jgi:arsenate reductase (glutaredoxin)